MNDTRKKISKLNQERKTLDQRDNKTKERVDTWRKGIDGLTDDLKAQVNILEELDSGQDKNDGGGGDVRRDYFEMIVSKLQKDIEELVRIC